MNLNRTYASALEKPFNVMGSPKQLVLGPLYIDLNDIHNINPSWLSKESIHRSLTTSFELMATVGPESPALCSNSCFSNASCLLDPWSLPVRATAHPLVHYIRKLPRRHACRAASTASCARKSSRWHVRSVHASWPRNFVIRTNTRVSVHIRQRQDVS